ncbi:MAG: hypothetical protein KatS3mg027_1922 [Bacteroidia bacterium]|nr:MAG: hypothetical protein KatS3mg027_1922 [Bacteroidia bacterium]
MRSIILKITFLLLSFNAISQVQLSPVLVGSVGGFYNFSGGSISASAGEAVILTINNSNNILTQGFHQPQANSSQAFSLSVKTYSSTCKGSNNGALKVIIEGGVSPFTINYEFEDTQLGYVPINTSADSIDTLYNLKPGNYIITVTDFYNRVYQDTVNIGIEYEGDCLLKIYSGFSPNGDGVNDTWIIDGIEFYPENSVAIYNRWGDIVWQKNAYDNTNVVWDGIWSFTGEKLPNGTYFYIINIPNQQFKGWVELTR